MVIAWSSKKTVGKAFVAQYHQNIASQLHPPAQPYECTCTCIDYTSVCTSRHRQI